MAQALPGPLGRNDIPLGACQRLCSGARRSGLPLRPGPRSLRPRGVGLSRGGARPGHGLCLGVVAWFLESGVLSRQSPPPNVCFDRKRGAAGGRGEQRTWASGRDS